MSTSAIENLVTICVATIHRPYCVRRFVESARRYLGAVRIIVVDQSAPEVVPASAYAGVDAEIIRLPFDIGVGAARNHAVGMVRTKYLLLCDDDFIIGPDTKLAAPLLIMEQHPDVAIVGGLLFDLRSADELSTEKAWHWENFISLDAARRRLTLTPLEKTGAVPQLIGPYQYFACDSVLNWAVMRTACFEQKKLKWDPQFKIAGEHEDFYLTRFLQQPDLGVCYCPQMVAYHHTVRSLHYAELRYRAGGWELFRDKWQVDEVIDDGFHVSTADGKYVYARSRADFDGYVAERTGRADIGARSIGVDQAGRLYVNDGTLTPEAASVLVLSPDGRPAVARLAESPSPSRSPATPLNLQPELEQSIELADALQRDLDTLRNSTSWRMMEPLRRLARRAGPLRQLVRGLLGRRG